MSPQCPRSSVPLCCPCAEYTAYESLLPYLEVSCQPDPSHVRGGWSQQPQPTTAVSHCSNTSASSLLRGNEPISRRYSYCNIWLTESVTSRRFQHVYVLLYFQMKTPSFSHFDSQWQSHHYKQRSVMPILTYSAWKVRETSWLFFNFWSSLIHEEGYA